MTGSYSDLLSSCGCCPRGCGVDRRGGESGYCGIGAEALIPHAGLHFGEEPPISGTRGSGAIFFAGCNLRCVFCQNHQISQEFRRRRARTLDTASLASEMLGLQDAGAHNINLVSPSHMIFQAADAIAAARRRGLSVPVVYNSNGYDSVDALRLIRGLVDIYLPDVKYMDDRLARRLSDAGDYADIVTGVIGEMLDQVGTLETDGAGIAVRGLLVRHLVLPGCTENSRRCLAFLADLSPDIHVSIMAQYAPCYRACECPGIDRPLSGDEYDGIIDDALALGLENAFVQAVESRDHYLPDFSRQDPFSAMNTMEGPSRGGDSDVDDAAAGPRP